MKNKILKTLFLFCFSLVICCGFIFVNGGTIETSDEIYVYGAQVRTTGKAGIRFVGKIGDLDTNNISKYGMMVAYGEVEVSNNFVLNGTINDKKILSTEISNLTSNGQFYITLFGIPESDYSQKITSRAYVVTTENDIIYSSSVTTRSLEDVVAAAYLDGDRSEFVTTVYQKIEENKHKHEYSNDYIYDDESHWKECLCGDISDKSNHTLDEGEVVLEPTFDTTGILKKKCLTCDYFVEETINQLESVYQITVYVDETIYIVDVEADGKYKLNSPSKEGYEFVGWIDSEDNSFDSEGVINANISVFATWNIAKTYTIDQLEERLNAKVEKINLASDIIIDRTLYITSNVTIYSELAVTLTRDSEFSGDLFVIGEDSSGHINVLKDGIVNVFFGLEDGTSKITIDGNNENVSVDVDGSVLFIVNGSVVNIYDGITICNNNKVSNNRIENWIDVVGNYNVGGAAAIIVEGSLRFNGGLIDNCSVNTELPADESDNNSIYGGAIFNTGSFIMNGGIISNCSANRGGAIYTKQSISINKGQLLNNYAGNKGGAICTSETSTCEIHMGSYDALEDTVIVKDNIAKVQGGGILTYYIVPIVIYGGVTFEGNQALSSNGGAISTPGAITIYEAKFLNNYAYEGGGAIYQYYIGEDTIAHIINIENTVFDGNSAGRGGAIIISSILEETYSSYTTLNINDCTFTNNSSKVRVKEEIDSETGETVNVNYYGSGGVLYITRGTKLTIRSSTFTSNVAEAHGGVMFITSKSNATIETSNFETNYAKTYGGAICGSQAKNISITSCNFLNNGYVIDTITQRGGAVYLDGTTATTKLCNFNLNKSTYGSSVYVSGSSVYTDTTSTYTKNESNYGSIATYGEINLSSSTFEENIAYINGGAIYSGTDSIININSSNFKGNNVKLEESESEIKRYGGAVYGANSTMTIKDCLFEKNFFDLPEDISNIKAYGGAVANTGNSSLSVDGCEFIGNDAMYGGAVAIYSYNGNTIQILNSTFNENSSSKYGGAAYINNAVAVITSINASQNTSLNGGVIYTSDCSSVTINGTSHFESNSVAGFGGAIAFSNTNATLSNGTFIKNIAESYGGAIHTSNSNVSIISTTFDSNSANINGGAVYVNGCTEELKVTTQLTTFNKNTALGNGGAVYVTTSGIYEDGLGDDNTKASSFTSNSATNGGAIGSYGSVNLNNTKISKNEATLGGAIYLTSSAELNDNGSIYDLNKAAKGGAIYVEVGTESSYGNVILVSSTFEGNEATQYGGAICGYDYANLTATNITVSSNSALVGGAIWMYSNSNTSITGILATGNNSLVVDEQKGNAGVIYTRGDLYIKSGDNSENIFGSEEEANTSAGIGGAIYVAGYEDDYSIVEIDDAQFISNTAAGNGGALGLLYSNATISNSIFNGNESTGYGGALHMIYSDLVVQNTSFISNNASLNGGAIYVTSPVTALITLNCEFTGNSSLGNGGAIYVTGSGKYIDGSSSDSTKKSTFIGNVAANGGAIGSYGSVKLYNSELKENEATLGGAIWATSSTAIIELNNIVFNSNSATDNGGAISLVNGAELLDYSSTYSQNTANNGGAIHSEGSVLEVLDSEFSSNTASNYAGAIGIDSSTSKLENIELISNSSDVHGGAIHTTQSNVILNDSSFSSNNTVGNGGAIYINGCTTDNKVISQSLTFTGNTSIGNGGAVYVTGSGIYEDGLSDDLTKGSIFTNNVAKYGGGLGSYGVVKLYGTNFEENEATLGGAIWMKNAASSLNATSINLEGNKSSTNGGSISLDTSVGVITKATFTRNIADSSGGAIHMTGSDLTIENSTFTSNSSVKNGGAIYITTTVNSLQTINCTFDQNTSEANGGAVYATGTGVYKDGLSDDLTKGSQFLNNTANNGGAVGIYGEAYMYGTLLSSNTATTSGGAIGVYGEVTINGATLTSNNAATSGGAIAVFEGGSLNIINSEVDNNNVTTTGSYTYMGGAISIEKSSAAVIDNVEFINNNGGESGGALGVYGVSAKATVSNSNFEENSAKNGGAMYIGGAGEVTISTSSFKGNSATNLGAIVYTTSGSASTLNLNSATIYNNNSDKSKTSGFIYINNALNVLNIYKGNIDYIDSESNISISLTDEIWSDLILNTKSGIVNEKTE